MALDKTTQRDLLKLRLGPQQTPPACVNQPGPLPQTRRRREGQFVSAILVRMARSTVPLVALILSACVGETGGLRYDRIQNSPQYIPEDLLTEIAEGRWTLEAIVQRLGQPDAASDEAHTIGYERCVESTASSLVVIGVPLPIPASKPTAVHCQLVKLWLDDDGRVTKWADRVGMRPDVQGFNTTYYLPCWIDSWVRGGSCER